jgi:predicted nucleotidyltransferase
MKRATSMITKENVLPELKQYRQEFGSQYGILSLGIFGSLSRGSASDKSDIDVVVRLKEPNLFTLSRIRIDLEERLHCPVDIVNFRERMNSFLKTRIQQEATYV